MFQLWYTKRYYLTHPHKFIQDIFANIQWTWQRIYRGWDDRVIWGIDQYIFEMMPQWLRALKENSHGVSVSFFEQDDDIQDDVTIEIAEKRFFEVLDEMILGFESGAKLVADDLNVYGDFEKYGIEKYGEDGFRENCLINKNAPYNKAWNEFDVIGKMEAETEKLKKELDRALELFCEYYYTLND